MVRIAVAVPAHDEVERIVACVSALLCQKSKQADVVVVVANNCSDDTGDRLRHAFGDHPRLDLRDVSLPPPFDHVGWARRLAMDAAADHLHSPFDVLMTTDADTVVADDWVAGNLRHLDDGCHVVAGAAHLMRQERAALPDTHRRRLLSVGKYLTAIAYLRSERAPAHDLWPRHDYEGGASIALRLADYRAMGGSPVLACHEDRALFDAVRANGGRVRHAIDVKVYTSCRLKGRASGGAADTLDAWGRVAGGEMAHGLLTLEAALDADAPASELCFHDLERELAAAKALVRQRHKASSLVGRASPEIQAV